MGCGSCSSTKDGIPAGCNNNGSCGTGCGNMLDVYDWLSNIYYIDDVVRHPLVEVRFKGTRKGFYKNPSNLALEIGQKVVVETAMGGHDVGEISLVGPLVKVQMKKYRVKENSADLKKIYRVTTENDLEKWRTAKAREYITQMKSREFAIEQRLQMKISDVEYQGDNTKATFYYTAEGRVDFRELIKVLARSFKVKIEMRQIGLRQEAGRLGGIGSCGRELCCSTWLTDFHSVPTTAARYQNLFLNPLKLSGQCGRLKCCLNYELDTYLEALEDFPSDNVTLNTSKGKARVVKTDILKGIMFFILEDDPTKKFMPLEVQDVKDLLKKQKDGEMTVIDDFEDYAIEEVVVSKEVAISGDIVADDLDRFDKRPNKGNKRKKPRPKGDRPQSSGGGDKKGPNDRKPKSPGDRNRPNRNDGNRSEGKPQSGDKSKDQNKENGPPQQKGQGPESKERSGQNKGNRNRNSRNRKPKGENPPKGESNNEIKS